MQALTPGACTGGIGINEYDADAVVMP